MVLTPRAVDVALGASEATLYTLTVSASVTRAQLVYLSLTNTTTADITVDVYREASGGSDRLFGDDITVPAKGTAVWKGMITTETTGDAFKALASATGIDALGTVYES